MTDAEYCAEYEAVLIGRRKTYSAFLFKNKTPKEQEKTAIEFLKVINKYYLRWTPEEMYYQLNLEILQKMHLKQICKYLQWPFCLNYSTDCFMIARKIYSSSAEDYSINEVDLCKEVYDRVMTGKSVRYPKNFFDGVKGYYRAILCFKYALNQQKTFTGPEDLFAFICDHGTEFLQQNKLYEAYKLNSESGSTPLDFLYESFGDKKKEKYVDIYEKYKQIEQDKE